MAWTKEQQKAIDLRGANLLVSAAAGSGKTAVLVERIVKLVCEDQYEIDKMLVMTFTKAAAAEMKERIGKRLMEEAVIRPDDLHIQEQLAYIHKAPISTIHSFCMDLLRNHFHMIGLEPDFRIGEEGENTLLRDQVMEEMMEDFYAGKEKEFLDFVEAYSYGKDDRGIMEMIERLYDFSMSHPDPDQWLSEAEEMLDGEPGWIGNMMEYGNVILQDSIAYLDQALRLLEKDSFLKDRYQPVFLQDQKDIRELLKTKTYEERVEKGASFAFKRLPAVRKKDEVDAGLMEEVKDIRNEVKAIVKNLIDDSFSLSEEDLIRENEELKPYEHTLISLVREFKKRYMECKMEKNMLEFSDLEHLALKLLIDGYEDGKVIKTPLAKELSDYYQAVFVDEYQDSNLIQEVLLQAVSREEDGNRFMVGDMKQSIYKFRMARPEIFLEKYRTYGEEGKNQKVELRNNFRSTEDVLYFINYIFYQIMKPVLGDLLYEKKVALTPPDRKKEAGDKAETAEMKETESGSEAESGADRNTDSEADPAQSTESGAEGQEILILDMSGTGEEGKLKRKNYLDEKTGEEYTAIEMEARMAAERIMELSGKYQYKDIVILLRTMDGWAEVFEEVLTLRGIPVHTDSRKGYFDTFEIRVLLNLLSVVDNLYQDIPMAAVLRSPIGRFTGEDLAMIRSQVIKEHRREESLYDEMRNYEENGEKEELREKIHTVLSLIMKLREEKNRLSLSELIWSALEKTGYYHLVENMPNGEQRMANLRMFMEKAEQYEKTSFKGVFHFLQYIEQLKSYRVDYGEAGMLGEEENVVRIMSIHKSKGLQFPVVFLSGMGKQFNFSDKNQRMLLHPDYYLGLDCINLANRTRRASQQKKMISKQLTLSMLGEEIRVLYVAMTRAEKKLVITGSVKDFGEFFREYGNNPTAKLGFASMSRAKNYLQWIFPALCRSSQTDQWKKISGIRFNQEEMFKVDGEKEVFSLKVKDPMHILGQEIMNKMQHERSEKEFRQWITSEDSEQEELIRKEIEKELTWHYPGEKELSARSKWSVSQLKEEKMEELFKPWEEKEPWKEQRKEEIPWGGQEEEIPWDTQGGEISWEAQGEEIPWETQSGETEKLQKETEKKEGKMPEFLKEEKKLLTGAGRGTAVHLLMEKMSANEVMELGFEQALEHCIRRGFSETESIGYKMMKKVKRFYSSDLAKRIARAEKAGRLYKEAQFMIGVPMKEMEPDTESEELVLLQGVIDLYMEEEDGLVLLDYKTDYVGAEGEKVLKDRYKTQLLWYKKALEQMTGKKVRETLIYSFGLSKTISVL